MTFKWTYLAIAIVAIAGILVSAWGSGPLGPIAHLYAILLFAIGGAAILFTRLGSRSVPATNEPVEDAPFVGYPKDRVLGIFDDRPAAATAITEFRDAGIAADRITVFSGAAGATELDTTGLSHGLLGVTQRSVEHLMTDIDDLERYEAAVKKDGVVIAVDAPEGDDHPTLVAIFTRNGGHDVYAFGSFAVQKLDVDPSRTRAH